MENNPEYFLVEILKNLDITFEKGDLSELLKNEFQEKRRMDFIIPDKKDPKVIIWARCCSPAIMVYYFMRRMQKN